MLTISLFFFCKVDYILFITAPVTLKVNENEVSEVKWVDPEELNKLMNELDCEYLQILTNFERNLC